jgi:hypothetical protein
MRCAARHHCPILPLPVDTGLAKHRRGTGEIRMTGYCHSQRLPYWSARRFCRNMPSGMLAIIHHHEAGMPQVCFAITKRAARMRTQLASKRLSSQRFLNLGITHLSMQKVCSFAAPFNSSHTEIVKLVNKNNNPSRPLAVITTWFLGVLVQHAGSDVDLTWPRGCVHQNFLALFLNSRKDSAATPSGNG